MWHPWVLAAVVGLQVFTSSTAGIQMTMLNDTTPAVSLEPIRDLEAMAPTQQMPKTTVNPQSVRDKALNFDIFTLQMYWWPGHCRASANIPKCDLRKMPPQWKSKLVVHGLWPGYSAAFIKANKLNPKARVENGVQKCNGQPFNKAVAPPPDDLTFPGEGVSTKNAHQYQWEKVAVRLGQQVNAKFALPKNVNINPAVSTTVQATAYVQQLGPMAQPICMKGPKGYYLDHINYCFLRRQGVGGPTKCPTPSQGEVCMNAFQM